MERRSKENSRFNQPFKYTAFISMASVPGHTKKPFTDNSIFSQSFCNKNIHNRNIDNGKNVK